MTELMTKGNATVKTYHLGFIRWKKWASINGISSVDNLPAKPFFVAIYLSDGCPLKLCAHCKLLKACVTGLTVRHD
jgi:hypothetical protein